MLVQVRELIYRELLEYHPHMLADYLSGNRQQPSFMYPSAVDNFKRQFAHLEGGGAYGGAAAGESYLCLYPWPGTFWRNMAVGWPDLCQRPCPVALMH